MRPILGELGRDWREVRRGNEARRTKRCGAKLLRSGGHFGEEPTEAAPSRGQDSATTLIEFEGRSRAPPPSKRSAHAFEIF